MIFNVLPTGTPYSALLVGALAHHLADLFTALFQTPGRKTWLDAGSTVSSFFTPAYLMDRAASEGRQVLFVAFSPERAYEMTQLLRDIYRRPVAGSHDERTRGSVTVLSIPELYMMLQEDPHGLAGMDAVLVEHTDETEKHGWLMRYLTDRSAAGTSVVGIRTALNQEQPEFYPFAAALPQWTMKDNPGETPLGDSAEAARTLLKNRYRRDPAMHFTRNSYEFAQEGTLVERYNVLSQLMGFAFMTGLGMQWVVERHTDIFGFDAGSFITLGIWCYPSIPTNGFAAHFVDEARAYQQQAVVA